jgi:hypothetical protein
MFGWAWEPGPQAIAIGNIGSLICEDNLCWIVQGVLGNGKRSRYKTRRFTRPRCLIR